eukprot:NODE_661_length_4933_cov_0.690112.p3 type:complete len:209 gc:universal NODE_661_length_4933_cov_0.690112:1071-445(-)
MGGFESPILHGMCTFGIAGKQLYQLYGNYDSIKCRLAKHVFPGETLVSEFWKEGNTVIFQVKVLERNAVVISQAGAELKSKVEKSFTKTDSATSSKSSAIFKKLDSYFNGLNAQEKQQLSKINGVFQFEITQGSNTEKWYIDLKSIKINQGEIQNDVVIKISDDDFALLAIGKLDGQKAFMSGKLKAKGNIMLTTKLTQVLKGAQSKL